MQEISSDVPQVECELLDVNGLPVTVRIDKAQALQLLQHFRRTFAWQIHWQAPATAQPAVALDLENFTQQVLSAATTVLPAGRFGQQQVFINHAWRAWQNSGGHLGLAEFKHWLSIAQGAGLLQLSCAALMETLNAVDLMQSEITSETDPVYHFIVLADAQAV